MSLENLPLRAELLLLLLDEEGRVRVEATRRRAAVAGAAVLELVLDGVLDLGPGDRKHARLVAVPGAEPRSATLGQVRDLAVGRTLKAAIARTGGASDWRGRADQIQQATLEELAASGIVERVNRSRLWFLTSTCWVVRWAEVKSDLVRRVATVLDGGRPDPQTDALVSLANAIGVLPKLFPDRDKKALLSRAEELGRDSWAGAAVLQVVREVEASVAAGVVAAVTASTS